jgi:hypothetical protein
LKDIYEANSILNKKLPLQIEKYFRRKTSERTNPDMSAAGSVPPPPLVVKTRNFEILE